MVRARNSNLLGKVTVLVMAGLCVNTALALDGSGSQQDPWRIKSFEDFNEFAADANYWAGFTRLETDVNLAGQIYSTAVIAWDDAFTGVFDGNEHKIANLTIDSNGLGGVGLFGYIVDPNAEIRNLVLADPNVDAGTGHLVSSQVGSLVAYSEGGAITDCYVLGGSVSGDFGVGGLVGGNSGCTITNCYSTGNVSGDLDVGGLVGSNNGTISDCYSTGDVSGGLEVGGLVGSNGQSTITSCYSTGDVNGGGYVGGLVGIIWDGTVSKCFSTGNVSSEAHTLYYEGFAGGLVGIIQYGTVSKCFSTGNVSDVSDVSAHRYVGGLVGGNEQSTITNCYSTGNLSGRDPNVIGGLVGRGQGHVENSYWNIETSGEPNMCGSWYFCDNSYGKTTSQLHQQSTFTDWDFIKVWNIGENQTYPYLRVYLAADINKDGIVNFFDFTIEADQWLEEQ
ncbi:MAG: GLUG motif-containing protein [Planctomycetota bacterium]|jgi:hypothetical protein